MTVQPHYYTFEMTDGEVTELKIDGRAINTAVSPRIMFESLNAPLFMHRLPGRTVTSFWANIVEEAHGENTLSYQFMLVPPPMGGVIRREPCEACGGETEIFLGDGRVTVKGEDLCEHCARWNGTHLEHDEFMGLRA